MVALHWTRHADHAWPHDPPDESRLADVTDLAVYLRLRDHPGCILYDPATGWLLLVGEESSVVTCFPVRSPGELRLLQRRC